MLLAMCLCKLNLDTALCWPVVALHPGAAVALLLSLLFYWVVAVELLMPLVDIFAVKV